MKIRIAAGLALAFALAAAPSAPAASPGFTAADLEAAANERATTHPLLARARERVAETDTLRAAFVLDPVSAWSILSADERTALARALGPDRMNGSAELIWFMRGAAAIPSGVELTGLYNALADAWLVLRWARVGGTHRIIDAAFVPGEVLRPANEADFWTDRDGLYGTALADSRALAFERFAALALVVSAPGLFERIAADRAGHQALAFARIDRWLASLAPWRLDPERRSDWMALRRRIVEGKAGPIAGLPALVRASLAPAAAIRRREGDSLLLVSPLYPELFVTADWPDSASGGEPRLGILNIANAGSPAGSEGAVQ